MTAPMPAAATDPVDETWKKAAACKGQTALFFPTQGESTKVAQAKKICAGCPVQEPCADYADTLQIRFGVWGGTSERQRRRTRRGTQQCRWCTRPFPATNPRTYLCSDECRRLTHLATQRRYLTRRARAS